MTCQGTCYGPHQGACYGACRGKTDQLLGEQGGKTDQ